VILVAGVALEYLILRNQTLCAFGDRDLVTELNWRPHLAALDQIGMWFEDRIDFPSITVGTCSRNTTACLIDHALSQPAIVADLATQLLDHQSRMQGFATHLAGMP
jgi:hypothetical protein